MDLEQLEALALSEDRAAALAALLPGTVEHDYWRGLHLQHQDRLDEVDEILKGWRRRHGHTDDHHDRLERRQLLLRAGADLGAYADTIRFKAGLSLDDQAEAVAAAYRYPSTLDPALIASDALLKDALDRSQDLSYLTDWALGDLMARASELDATRRRHLLQRLPRVNLPGVVAAIATDLAEKGSRGFGSLPVHQLLTLAQLHELAERRTELRQNQAWVQCVIARMRPPNHLDRRTDPAVRAAWLAELWGFVSKLAPSFNALKAQILYHQLDHDRGRGVFDRDRFLAYLELPRATHYVSPEWLRKIPNDQIAQPGANAGAAAGIGEVPDDEPLVREYLHRFLAVESETAFATRLRAEWLDEQLATTRLLSGDPDAEKWATRLGPTKLAELRDRVEIELTVRNPPRFAADDPVALEVDVKNVPALVVKVFRINALAYFLARGGEVDTSLDLDGMVASDERTIRSEARPIRRERQRIDLPGCARAGTYVVELIGNGRSSRALIRKGVLRHTVRIGAAGPVVRVLDEAGRPAIGASVWLGGREYTPRDDGGIAIPFSTQPGAVPMMLVHGEIAQREVLHHPGESYHFTAGLHLERQTLVPGKVAKVVIRPVLSVAGWPAPLALIQDAKVEIKVTDLAGTSSSKTQAVKLGDDGDTVVELHVPEDSARIGLWLRGQIRVASTQTTIDVVDGAEAEINLIHRSAHTEALHLATTAGGHVLSLLGKTGEPRGGRAVSLQIKHVAVTFEVGTTCETDDRGRIELGALAGVERISACLPSGMQQAWSLWPQTDAPAAIHAVAGTPIALPAPVGITAADLPHWLSLTEVRDSSPRRDATGNVTVEAGALILSDLEPGTYTLACRGLAPSIAIVVAPASAVVTSGWASSGPLMTELSPPVPLIRDVVADDDQVTIRISSAGPHTRVHLVATRFRPDLALPRNLRRSPRSPSIHALLPVLSHYVSGRDIGEEYRYVLERRTAPRRPGTLLEKPPLLLNPWALRTTSSSVQTAAEGGGYGASGARAGAPAPRPQAQQPASSADGAAFVTVDFLAAPATVLANLRPDASGVITVRRSDLGAAQLLQITLVDQTLTSTTELALAEHGAPHRDLRLRQALGADRHFAEDRRVTGAAAGSALVVDDVRSGKLELVDTIARAHQVLLTLGGNDALREFSFVAQWHALDDATRCAKYSKYACHELHLFLFVKDPAFFTRVVRPHLAHKRHKTFVDRWLLGDSVAGDLEPWSFARLNTVEQVLLARKVPAVRDAIARLVGDAVDLIPPDPERDARLVDTLLGATALEGGGLVAGAAPDAAMDEIYQEKEEGARSPKAKKKAERRRGDEFGAAMGRASAGAGPMPPPAPSSAPMKTMMMAIPEEEAYSDDLSAGEVDADLSSREESVAFYRGADKTQEWAESDWWHTRVEHAVASVIPPNRFWRDLARHGDGPFLSAHLGECTSSFAESLCALAFLDLPFVASKHEIVVDDSKLTLTAGSHALAARTRLGEVAVPEQHSPILVGQSYFRADDRWEWDGAEQREKYVTGELLSGVVYQCQVVVTNPTSAHQKLDVLLQIPKGAIQVNSGFLTRTMHLHLGAYGTQALEYGFYFPSPGSWSHFPAHVTRAGELVAFAAPTTLEVVREPTVVDTGSWAHVSQHGTTDDVLGFLGRANLGRIELDKIAWRMRERDAFTRVTALLAARHHYHDRLWAYGLLHADATRVAEWLRHQDHFVRPAGPVLERGAVQLDPVRRHWYQHLEYAPLINARAHQLGARRRILNDALGGQYRAFLDVVAHRIQPGDDDLLAAAHYLFTLDRNDDALAHLARVRADAITTRVQHDYLAAYAACCRGDLAEARRLAVPWIGHAVDRWRHRYAALGAMLDEVEGRGPAAAVDADSRDQKMAALAARQPALDLLIEHGAVVVQHHNLTACQVRFYKMDIELLFSRQPFVQGDVERFSFIEPGVVVDLPLTLDGRTTVPIPETMRGANLVVEAIAPGLRRSVAHYAHDLATQLTHQYGQVRVLRATSQTALTATYVKVYARQHGGTVSFYKDGYTDLRGRFDYATLSTNDLDRVERFALLVVSDDAGATVLEAPPPQR